MKHSRDTGYQAGRSAKRPRPDGGRNYHGYDERRHGNAGPASNTVQKDVNPPNLWKQTASATDINLPPLPEIRDPKNLASAFTHTSAATRANPSYEHLEWYGDSVIEMVATNLIWDTYPATVPAGRMSQIRETIVNNTRLAAFATGYGFQSRLNIAPTKEITASSRTKVLGDVFEAYVGAVALDDRASGESRADAWLAALWTPFLLPKTSFGDEDERVQDAVKMEASRVFAPSGSGCRASYEDLSAMTYENKAQQRFHVGFFFTGLGYEHLQLGEGFGQNKKTARARAAKAALDNKEPFVGEIREKVDVYLKERRALKAKEEAEKAKEEAEKAEAEGEKAA